MPKNVNEKGCLHVLTTMHLDWSPEQVFPLLCPVREYDWIPYWKCDLIHSRSGLAEVGCVFTTQLEGESFGTWICTRYEPPLAVDYVTYYQTGYLRRLALRLIPNEQGCILHWSWTHIGTTPEGKAAVDAIDKDGYQEHRRVVEGFLNHYLKTGTLPPAA